MKEVLIIKYGEIALRKNNRFLFERQLISTIQKNIASLPGYSVIYEQGRFVIENSGNNFDYSSVIPKITPIMGLIGVCPCVMITEKSIEAIRTAALIHMEEHHREEAKTFKVVTQRADKQFPVNSQQVSADIGEFCLNNMSNLTVDVNEPEIVLRIEIRNKIYIYSKQVPCLGGLPVGSSGKALCLLSAGIDSPVAVFLMAKRGVLPEVVYFHSPPYTSEGAKDKVMDICSRIAEFTGSIKLYVVDFTEVQLYIRDKTPSEKLTIMLKRSMLKISERIAEANAIDILVTGDSVGQVASQTLKSIVAIDRATYMTILRPLSGMDKQEIVDLAKKIGTYPISIRPFDDCCTLFVAKHPETKPKASIIESIESKMDALPALIDKAISLASVYEI